jgi:hypothetical protein
MLISSLRIFWAKATNHEYWPWYLVYAPLLPQYLYYSLLSRSWVWFTNVNTSIPLSGFFGESKKDILDKIHTIYKPLALFIDKPVSSHTLKRMVNEMGIDFPFILKPDEGERGIGVAKITNEQDLELYLLRADFPLIAQEFVAHPLEFGVFYSRIPGTNKGRVISLTGKQFLTVIGDGEQTIAELVSKTTRGLMQLRRLGLECDIEEILPKGHVHLLEPIGNHSRGTLFYDAGYLITEDMNTLFTDIAKSIGGFQFGRFDLRVNSVEALSTGANIRVLELNGISSDPTHIYDPKLSYWEVARYLVGHLHILYCLSREQKQKGVLPASLAEVRSEIYRHNSLLKERGLLKATARLSSKPTYPTLQPTENHPTLG